MPKKIIRTNTFIRKLSKLDKSYLERVEKLILRVIANPDIGKPMRYDRKGTRELYLKPYRLAYFYDKKEDALYFVDVYHKNEQ